MRIGVCIPCHEKHIKYIPQCLESIEHQTRKPDLVCIGISGSITPLELPIYSFPVKIIYTANNQCASTNRNAAARISYNMEALTFFDADDMMHPRRIEVIEQHLQYVDGLVHNHKLCSTNYRTLEYKNISWEDISKNLYTDGFKSSRDICGRVESQYGSITCGHFSCKINVWNTIKYPEGYGIGEDSEYVYNVYQKYKIGYSPDILSYYIRDDVIDEYFPQVSEHRPPVYSNYDNTEMKNVIDYLLSEQSPEREYPIVFNIGPDNNFKKILYNIEQLTRESELTKILSRISCKDIIEVWDYSITNCNILKVNNIEARHVPFRLSIERILEYRCLNVEKVYDIFFCGQMSEYRMNILDELRKKGKEVLIFDGNYSTERDINIGKSKLLINIHYNETYRVFESVRCEPWLASGFPVLSEESVDNDPRCTTVSYEKLVDKACEMLDGK